MGTYVQALALTITGIVLLRLGYSMLIGFYPEIFMGKKGPARGEPGDPQVCPVCTIKMVRGDLVKSLAFPSLSGGRDRLMYIRGCFSCLEHNVPRRCPICGKSLSLQDYLVSRMFDRPGRNNHVHVIGCNHCRRMGSLAR
ncbi:MAG: hypothetical protein FWB83_09115 [Treponema sp.]|nr:hypothetical protein [Treponema sp.]